MPTGLRGERTDTRPPTWWPVTDAGTPSIGVRAEDGDQRLATAGASDALTALPPDPGGATEPSERAPSDSFSPGGRWVHTGLDPEHYNTVSSRLPLAVSLSTQLQE